MNPYVEVRVGACFYHAHRGAVIEIEALAGATLWLVWCYPGFSPFVEKDSLPAFVQDIRHGVLIPIEREFL